MADSLGASGLNEECGRLVDNALGVLRKYAADNRTDMQLFTELQQVFASPESLMSRLVIRGGYAKQGKLFGFVKV